MLCSKVHGQIPKPCPFGKNIFVLIPKETLATNDFAFIIKNATQQSTVWKV